MELQKHQKITLLSVGVVLLVGVIGFYSISNIKGPPSAVERAQALESPELRTNFNAFLEKFLKSVETGMADYKAERKVLVEAAGPLNLRQPEYVEENYSMSKQLTSSLRVRIDHILHIFREAEADVGTLLTNEPAEVRRAISEEWSQLKQKQEKVYIDYFAVENELLAAYDDLMNFYYAKRYEFQVDVDSSAFVFKLPEDDAEAKRLQQRIDDLYAKEKAILNEQPAAEQPATLPQ